MSTEALEELKELLKATARAHHAATGGVNLNWAEWYAEHLYGALPTLIGATPSISEVAEWLTSADIEYRAEDRGTSWPRYYAGFIADRAGDSG